MATIIQWYIVFRFYASFDALEAYIIYIEKTFFWIKGRGRCHQYLFFCFVIRSSEAGRSVGN